MLALNMPAGVSDRATLECNKLNYAKRPNTIGLGSPQWWERIEVSPSEIISAADTDIRDGVLAALERHGELSKDKIRVQVGKGKKAVSDVVEKMAMDGELEMREFRSAKLFSIADPTETEQTELKG